MVVNASIIFSPNPACLGAACIVLAIGLATCAIIATSRKDKKVAISKDGITIDNQSSK